MKKKIIALRECSIMYFLKALALEIGFFDLSDNKFCQIFESHQGWMNVFFGQNSDFNPPPINYIEPNKFCELAIKNDWMWKIISLAESNGNKLSFDKDQLKLIPSSYFQDRINTPDIVFIEAIDIYLWFATAVRDCDLSVELNTKSFVYQTSDNVSTVMVNPLDEADPVKIASDVVKTFRSISDWKKTIKKLGKIYPKVNLLHLREWVRKNLEILTALSADELRPLFGLLPRKDVQVDDSLWIDGEPDDIPTVVTDVPNKGQIEHPCGLTLTQITVDAILFYCFELGKEEEDIFSGMFDSKKIDTISQQIGIGPGIYLVLVRHYRGSLEASISV